MSSYVAPAATSKSRMLILCFDGTDNQYSSENTNVVKFYSLLKKDIEHEQLCYYQTGIGTYENPGFMTPLSLWMAKTLDEAFAWYLDAHVMGGYKFIMQNYCVGDKICLFGFSRGAYTARALAGMLTKVGLLPQSNIEQVPFAYKLYTATDSKSVTEAAGFKQTFCRSVPIEFIGVWETVSSTGVVMSKSLPFTLSNSSIRIFRQALALDEHRAKFQPMFCLKTDAGGLASAQQVKKKRHWSGFKVSSKGKGKTTSAAASPAAKELEIANEPSTSREMDLKEVWFAGVHADVGGGSASNDDPNSLANIPLRWMVREVIASQCGIQFDDAAMLRLNIHINLDVPRGPESNASQDESNKVDTIQAAPMANVASNSDSGYETGTTAAANPKDATGTNTNVDAQDCLQPEHDQLSEKPAWWLLEIIPMPFSWQNKDGVWKKKWEFHLGKGRYPSATDKLLFHTSVKTRMADMKYTPRLKFQDGTQTYVD